ncbi:hypothetical protein IEQ34_002593 [Dendrobium chrysotoxum]|uniref:Uncharacterized protein n=1 Tax=Dendrobium chrysotoxum TaxID=161865 RepID=A0AAV7HHF4_DENCH|nr:hypothetical protein IEQ34_002593 [Dendrobium chrysotoxum]
MNDFLSFYDHAKTLGHSKHECFHLHSHLRKISTIKPKNVEANIQVVGVVTEVEKALDLTSNKSFTGVISDLPNHIIQVVPNDVNDFPNPNKHD